MWYTRIFLIAVILVKVNARPDGYGVKGGRVPKATANAVASAHATAHADAGSFGAAKSFASAIATASSNGDAASDAIAHANASIVGGNIERGEPGGKENGNANELGDSDDLRESNDRGKDVEYKSINQQDGTPSWNPRTPDAEHVASGADDADSWKTEQTHDEPDCSPLGVKGHRGTSHGSKGRRCKGGKPAGNPELPAQNGNIELSADWQHSTRGNGGEASRPGTIDRGHAASPCTPGDAQCHIAKPAIFDAKPSYETHPVLPDDSLKPPGIQASYGQNIGKPESPGTSPCASPCANGDSKCAASKPSTANPSNGNHPELPANSLKPPRIETSYGGIDGSHFASPCAPGDSKCFIQNPSVSNPYPTAQQHPDSSIGSSKPTESSSGYGGNTEKPGIVDRSYAGSPCGSESSKCFRQKPDAPNTESYDSDIDGVYAGNHAKPGQSNKHANPTPKPCAGDSKCVPHKPTSTGHHSDDAEHSIEIGSQYGGNSQKPGTSTSTHSGHPCAAGDSKCSAQKPDLSDAYPSHGKNPHSPAGSSSSGNTDGGYGGSGQEPGTIGGPGHRAPSPCAPLDWTCLSREPTVPSPRPTYEKNPYLSAGSHHPMGPGSGTGGHKPETLEESHLGSQCAPSDSKCSTHKPSGPNVHPTYNTNPFSPTYEGHSIKKGDGSQSVGGSQGTSGKQPGTSNPFLNGEIDVSSIKSSPTSDKPSRGVINPSNPFLNPQSQVHPSTDSHRPTSSNGNDGSLIVTNQQRPQAGSSGNTGYPQVKPNPSNPFLHPHGQVNPTAEIQHPGTISGTQTTSASKFPSSPAQPGMNGLPDSGCHGSASCAPNKPSELFPIVPEHPHESGHHETKPNPPNPFFQHHGHEGKPADSKYPEANSQNEPHAQTGMNQPPKPINDCHGLASCFNAPPPGGPPKNPFLTNHGPKVGAHGATAGHKPTQYPDSHGSSTLGPETGASVLNPFLSHNKDKPQPGHGSGSGISFHDCKSHDGPTDKDDESSVTEAFKIDRRQNNYGVKGHRPGVKGGSRGPPMKLQGISGPGGHIGPGRDPAAQSAAVASADAFSHASASSSSSITGGRSSASAKSEAYSRNQSADGLSGSWASSRAHASASATSYSSSGSLDDQGEAAVPEVPTQ